MNNSTLFIERPLTEQERSLTLWMLEHGSQEASTFLSDLERVTVVGRCPCGCDTVDFAVSGIRLIGVGVSNFSGDQLVQQTLFDADPESQEHAKQRKLDAVSDAVRDKFGSSSLSKGNTRPRTQAESR